MSVFSSEDAAVMTFYQNAAFLIGAPLIALSLAAFGPVDAQHPSRNLPALETSPPFVVPPAA